MKSRKALKIKDFRDFDVKNIYKITKSVENKGLS